MKHLKNTPKNLGAPLTCTKRICDWLVITMKDNKLTVFLSENNTIFCNCYKCQESIPAKRDTYASVDWNNSVLVIFAESFRPIMHHAL